MGQVVKLDATTILIKSDNENDLAEIINFASKKNKLEHVNSFLKIASENKILGRNYKFNREDCYDKQNSLMN